MFSTSLLPSGSSKVASSSSPRTRLSPYCVQRRPTGLACSLPRPANAKIGESQKLCAHPVQHCWEVKPAHLVPRKFPEWFLIWVQMGVVSAVPEISTKCTKLLHTSAYQPKKNGKQNSHVASKVAEPDVIAGVSEKEAERFASISDHPVSGGAEQPVLSIFILRYFANLIEF